MGGSDSHVENDGVHNTFEAEAAVPAVATAGVREHLDADGSTRCHVPSIPAGTP